MLSLSFLTCNAGYLAFTLTLMAVSPLFTITIDNRENEAYCAGSDPAEYTVQCFAFQSVVTNYENKIICEDSTSFPLNCWDLMVRINTGGCNTGNDLCDELVGLNSELENYMGAANLFSFLIVLFGSLSFVCLVSVYAVPSLRESFWQLQAFLLLVAAGVAAGLMHVSAQTVEAASVQTSYNTGQTLSPNAGLVVLVVFPLFQLLSINMVSLWDSPTSS